MTSHDRSVKPFTRKGWIHGEPPSVLFILLAIIQSRRPLEKWGVPEYQEEDPKLLPFFPLRRTLKKKAWWVIVRANSGTATHHRTIISKKPKEIPVKVKHFLVKIKEEKDRDVEQEHKTLDDVDIHNA